MPRGDEGTFDVRNFPHQRHGVVTDRPVTRLHAGEFTVAQGIGQVPRQPVQGSAGGFVYNDLQWVYRQRQIIGYAAQIDLAVRPRHDFG